MRRPANTYRAARRNRARKLLCIACNGAGQPYDRSSDFREACEVCGGRGYSKLMWHELQRVNMADREIFVVVPE